MRKDKKATLDKLVNRLKGIKAKDIMTKDVITTTEDATLSEIAGIMIKKRISGLPVVDKKKKVIGVITAKDLFIMMDMIESGDVIDNTTTDKFNPTVKFSMSAGIDKIKKNTTLDEIIAIVKYKNLYTIPVFEKNKMVGVIGRRDIFKNFYNAIMKLQ